MSNRNMEVNSEEIDVFDLCEFLEEGLDIYFVDSECHLLTPNSEGIIEGIDPYGSKSFSCMFSWASAMDAIVWAREWRHVGVKAS